jgi:flavin-dependent dehydrogenase
LPRREAAIDETTAAMTIESEHGYDALIVGGGPAGSTAAILLAQAGWRVAVVERKPFPRRKVCGEFISATSWPLLRELGIAESLLAHAGPEVRRVGLYAGATTLAAAMPPARDATGRWGRAVGREHFDSLLLARAKEVGAAVLQPWTVSRVESDVADVRCTIVAKEGAESTQRLAPGSLRARIVIAAHGSWEPGPLPTQQRQYPQRPSDLFGFKAHFRGARLPPGLMPLLVFPHGYGGMVHAGHDRVSLSCCIRRDALEQCRRARGMAGASARAADAVFAHIEDSCAGVREACSGATLEGAWLSAGPIRPGIRPFALDRIFAVGNAAGEAHPVVAEGISMAIQSAWLLCELLVARKDAILADDARAALAATGRDYERHWRRQFETRIRAAALFAHLSMRPPTARQLVALARRVPAVLTLGAQWSGKTRTIPSVGVA